MNSGLLSAEERQVIDTVARFISKEVIPNVSQLERASNYPDFIVNQMKVLGLFGIAVPQEYGGLGLRIPVFAAVLEELAKGWSTLAAYVNSHSTVAYAIGKFGTQGQKDAFLPGMASGEVRAALCLTEAEAGSDLQAIRSSATRSEKVLTLNGAKIYVTNGRKADLLMVLAKSNSAVKKAAYGMSLLLVPSRLPGVSVTTDFEKMAFGKVDTVGISFESVSLTEDLLLGAEEGKGFGQLMDALEIGRIAIAASAVGLAAAALSAALRFAADRKTFGKTINEHQAIQLRLADMATRLVAARQMTLLAAQEKQRGNRADMVSAMAKLFASETCTDLTQEALRVHGGHGYISDYPVERFVREALLYLVGEGTNDIQKLVINRRLQEGSENGLLGLPY
ncbi:MAG TPA: acyl-CoA dehydrogenase family protein [Aestuariivirga sp.]|nr:acyl-CoA dehydrogenase family protein [Aestuariivirga sp.]